MALASKGGLVGAYYFELAHKYKGNNIAPRFRGDT